MAEIAEAARLIRLSVSLLACALLGAACVPGFAAGTPTPAVQTVEVTRIVTHAVTSEVTRLVEVPVTLTPSPTPELSPTPSPSPTLTRRSTATTVPQLPRVSVLVHSACMYGPGTGYLFKYGLNATVWMKVVGRNEDGSWLFVKGGNDPDTNGCWIKTSLVKFLSGDVGDVPVFWNSLPGSVLYRPPAAVSANRVGNEVTIFWQPVWMTEDDYRGYLIEAWVCQGGSLVFVPIGYVTSVFDNTSMKAAKVTDEPGCSLPSRARIYTVEKHGYTWYRMIAWPTFEAAAGAAPLPTPTPTP
jgi:hypothetical protein